MALTDYSDFEKDIKDAPAPKTLPKGTEVKARIIKVRSGISEESGAQWYSPVFDVPKDPTVIEFNDFFWDLTDRDKLDDKQFQRGLHQFKTFALAFGIDFSRPFDWEDDLPGKEGWLIVGVKKSDEYGDRNSVSKYLSK
jgi:hypothetical protein